MKLHRDIAIGILMVVLSITIPVLSGPLRLDWPVALVLTGCCWALSWFGSLRASKAWVRLRIAVFMIEKEEALEAMDQRYQRKESQ